MFNSRIINGLKEELKIKSQIIELQEQIVSLLLKQNEMLLSKLLENENTTTENSDVQVNTIFDGKVIGDSIATVLKKSRNHLWHRYS